MQAQALRSALRGSRNRVWRPPAVAVGTVGVATRCSLPVPRCPELGHQRGLLELADSAEHLSDQDCSRGVGREEVGRRRRHQLNTQLLEIIVAGKLNRQITRETVWALYEDATHAIAGDAGKHGLEARTLCN